MKHPLVDVRDVEEPKGEFQGRYRLDGIEEAVGWKESGLGSHFRRYELTI